jgi:hypothetical protein
MGIPGRAMDLLTVAQFLLRLRLDVKQEKVMGGLARLVRCIAIGRVPLVIASCAAVFGAGPAPPVRPSAGAGGLVSSLMHGAEIPLRGMDPVRWPTRIRGGILLTNRRIAGLLGILVAF